MAYRDDKAALKDRIDRLELSLARTSGRAILLEEQRDELHAELERLTRDPRALARLRGKNQDRKSLYQALRVAGWAMLSIGLLPMIVFAIAILASGELAGSLLCGSVPALIIAGVFVLRFPEVVRAIELRQERKVQERRARAKVRVELDSLLEEEEAAEPPEAQAVAPQKRTAQ